MAISNQVVTLEYFQYLMWHCHSEYCQRDDKFAKETNNVIFSAYKL